MFTGLVQAVGSVVSNEARVLIVEVHGPIVCEPFELGESVAINGCCLTVTEVFSIHLEGKGIEESGPVSLTFELSEETLLRTNLGALAHGHKVNVERAMKASDRFGGHIVQGHVDTVGAVVSIVPDGEFIVMRFRAPAEYDRYLIDKGSVAVNGVSLTVILPEQGEFEVALIPHTLSHTNLGCLKAGSQVNLEFDVLAKHLEKLSSNALRHV
ncbi:MAG: riboflavin synthase subunit alpha [Armatimonadetes bacterium 55-13]|nr:riboflavin synthase [Armatimonadota bacterium]OJU62908.1 MAG: riboflavin synthase subunit alpha [Armatimonadetes bacterium 55-13]